MQYLIHMYSTHSTHSTHSTRSMLLCSHVMYVCMSVLFPLPLQRHGTGTLVFPNGNTYMGDFKKNSMTGHGVMTYWNQDVYEGEFKNGLVRTYGVLVQWDLC